MLAAAQVAPPRFTHQRHRPEQTLLHAAVESDLETMLAAAREESDSGAGLPGFVEEEFRRYLDCGILAKGFLRLRCESCGKDALVAFSCKRRALCPSCGHRRMQDVAAHLVDSVLPDIPYRQFVITFPKWLRIPEESPHSRPKSSTQTAWARTSSANFSMRRTSFSGFIMGMAL